MPLTCRTDLAPYLSVGPVPSIADRSWTVFPSVARGREQSTVSFLVRLNGKVRDEVGYVTRLDPGIQSSEQTLDCRTGSCRDRRGCWWSSFGTWDRGAVCLGVLIQLSSGGTGVAVDGIDDGVKLTPPICTRGLKHFCPEPDGSAWIQPRVSLPARGISLWCARQTRRRLLHRWHGRTGSCRFDFSMSVRRHQCHAVGFRSLSATRSGKRCEPLLMLFDADLKKQDVRLTMGGEADLRRIDTGPESRMVLRCTWCTETYAWIALIRGLREYLTGALMLHYGQGKWYPASRCRAGRWSPLSAFRRGRKLPALAGLAARNHHGFGVHDALEFAESSDQATRSEWRELAARVQFCRLGRAGRLCAAAAPTPAWRAIVVVEPVVVSAFGAVASVSRRFADGYRIPTEAMPWVAPDELQYELMRPLTQNRVKLSTAPRRPDLFAVEPEPDPLPPLSTLRKVQESHIRPSLCVQARDGRLDGPPALCSKLPTISIWSRR